jgi:hypothetical protein
MRRYGLAVLHPPTTTQLFHLLRLSGGFIEPRLEVRAPRFPRLSDG